MVVVVVVGVGVVVVVAALVPMAALPGAAGRQRPLSRVSAGWHSTPASARAATPNPKAGTAMASR